MKAASARACLTQTRPLQGQCSRSNGQGPRDLIAFIQRNLKLDRDSLRGWLPPSMPVGEDADRDTLERSFDEAFGTSPNGEEHEQWTCVDLPVA
jgi:hypothetical protein